MTASLTAALVAAGLLGVTHAMEPDHVAGISALSSEEGDFRRSTLIGACFAAGHVALVVAWVSVGYLFLGRSTFPPVFDAIGTVGVSILLGILGALMTWSGMRRILHVHTHEHDDVVHRHPHLHLRPGGSRDHDHDHDVRSYLRTGAVGALFTLSPPLTMIAFASTLFPRFGSGVVTMAVCVYAVAIVGTMGLLGAGVGLVFGLVDDVGVRSHAVLQIVAGVLLGAFSLSLLGGSPLGVF